MAENNLQAKTDFTDSQLLSVDFAEQFNKRLTSLFTMLNLQRKMPLSVGSVIKTYKDTVTLENGTVGEGEDIPLSKVKRTVDKTYEIVWSKYRKAVPIELIQRVGYDQAVDETDDKLIREIQKKIRDEFFTFLQSGGTSISASNLQMACADAWAKVVSAFPEDDVDVILFLNPEDVAKHLGGAQLTTQTAFGLRYIEGFLGSKVAIIHPSIEKGKLYATASQNLVFAYAKLDGEAKKGFEDMQTDESAIIGVIHDKNTKNLTNETVAMLAIKLYAELSTGVVIGTITGV